MKKMFFAAIIAVSISCTDGGDEPEEDPLLMKKDAKLEICYPLIEDLSGGKIKIINSLTKEEVILDPPYSAVELYPGEHVVEEINAPNGYGRNVKAKRLVVVKSNKIDSLFFYNSPAVAEKLSLYYENRTTGNRFLVGADYNGIRIGEYYWMDTNMNHIEPSWTWWTVPIGEPTRYPLSQTGLDKYLTQLRLDKSSFQVDTTLFHKYYGRYFDGTTITYMNSYAKMYEGDNKELTGWKQATLKDFRQLFGMCPFVSDSKILGEQDVRRALSAKKGDNPMTNYTVQGECGGLYWFDPDYVTNMYGFNMMPGGARINMVSEGQTTPWATNLCGQNTVFQAVTGDIYHLFFAVKYKAQDGYISIHDNVDTGTTSSYHWQNIRWCRKLADDELGYKIYIKSSNSNITTSSEWQTFVAEGNEVPLLRKIRKGSVNASDFDIVAMELLSPDVLTKEWIEVPNGYLRGFYVQYFVPDKNGAKHNDVTVADVITYAANVDDASLK